MSEYVIYEGKADPCVYRATFLFLLLFTLSTLGAGVILAIPVGIWNWLELRAKKYRITSHKVETGSPLLGGTQSIELKKVRELKFERDFWDKLTGSCSIILMPQLRQDSEVKLRCFAHEHGRSIYGRLQFAVSEARRSQ